MKNTVKIMTYNILNGFHTIKEPYKLEKNRMEAVKRIVKKENPDILCLTEACFACPNQFNIKVDYQKLFKFKHVYASSRKSQWGNMILSKYPLDKVYPVTDERFICIRSKFIINGKNLYVDIIHPSPRLREKEVIKYLRPILKDPKKHYILTGDFNALSDQDDYDINKLKAVIKKIEGENYENAIKSVLDMKLIPWLRKQNLMDVMKKFGGGFTIPTDLLDKTKESPARLDYFFASKKINTKSAKVIRGKDAEIGSDHYPIVINIEI